MVKRKSQHCDAAVVSEDSEGEEGDEYIFIPTDSDNSDVDEIENSDDEQINLPYQNPTESYQTACKKYGPEQKN